MPSCTGCTKPIASNTRPASSTNSAPGTGLNLSSTWMQWSFFTRPFSPVNFCVSTENSRLAPSSWLDEVRSLSGQFGQGSSFVSFSGGIGMISKLVTDNAPWRIEVPMQSEPVSPPPTTTTCLSLASIGSRPCAGSPPPPPVLLRQETHGEMDAVELAARDREVARLLGAARQHDRVVIGDQLIGRDVDAHMGAVVERHAFGFHLRDAAVDVVLLHLEVGNAVTQQPARLGEFLVDMDVVAGARELLGAGHAGRTRSDDGDPLAGLVCRRLRLDPALLEGLVG